MEMKPKLYLLAGNGAMKAWFDDCLPHFQQYQPHPLDLPGSGDNPSNDYRSLAALAQALIDMTEPGHPILVVGINGLVVLHALVRRPGHFSTVYLLAPVGAFLAERKLVKIMSPRPVQRLVHHLLANHPRLFRKKFSDQTWTSAQYARMGQGYKKSRSFQTYFQMVNPVEATDLFEWITDRIVLIWGKGDRVLAAGQAAAWDGILPRAALEVILREDWGHYPYIDQPQAFATWLESHPTGFPGHSKAGRLKLAAWADLPVPPVYRVTPSDNPDAFAATLPAQYHYAVRSSGATEDHIDHSNAGVNTTYLRVPAHKVAEKLRLQFAAGMEEVAVQVFVEPKISGVAFVRGLSAEIELVEGHLEALVNGEKAPISYIQSRIGGDWDSPPSQPLPAGFPTDQLWHFLQQVVRAFHYQHSDIEWAWDGNQFWLFQTRPVTTYAWRRTLSSANLDEILSPAPSRLMEHAQRHAARSIGRQYAAWDSRVLRDQEPFTVVHDGASYLNFDLFLGRFSDWGLPSSLLTNEIGSAAPPLPFRLGRLLRSVPILLRMRRIARKAIMSTAADLKAFEQEFHTIQGPDSETRLAEWFVRYYVYIVRRNMLINACLSSAGGKFLFRRETVYSKLGAHNAPHRVPFESDPAAPRANVTPLPIADFPDWPSWAKILHSCGMPGLGGLYFELREWFRDNNMRLFHALHLRMAGSHWLLPHEEKRRISGTFWQDGSGLMRQGRGFIICAGVAEGILGQDILVEDALEPGHFPAYQAAQAVIAKTGGRLSHGATLLREIKKPSAVIPDLDPTWIGKRVRFENGALHPLE